MTSAETFKGLTPEKALDFLKAGNERFIEGESTQRDHAQEISSTAKGQNPFALVHGCIDSRTPAETIFDQGIGDLFHTRVAGNVLDDDTLGSMEFASQVVGTPLILIMGHTGCGAVRGALDGVELGHLTGILQKIHPAIEKTREQIDPTELVFPDMVARNNVKEVVRAIPEKSPVLKALQDQERIAIKGAMYDVGSGRVEFL